MIIIIHVMPVKIHHIVPHVLLVIILIHKINASVNNKYMSIYILKLVNLFYRDAIIVLAQIHAVNALFITII